jgi:hypothetical protein
MTVAPKPAMAALALFYVFSQHFCDSTDKNSRQNKKVNCVNVSNDQKINISLLQKIRMF